MLPFIRIALIPIAIGMIDVMNISPALMFGSVIGGAMFGDNMSMISDTTIAATRTQNVAMRDKFIMNFKMVLPAAIICIVIYLFCGFNEAKGVELAPTSWKDVILIIPYLFILIGALLGMNVIALLFSGTCVSFLIGITIGGMDFWKSLGIVGSGTLSMAETLIVAILAGGLLNLIRINGGITYLMQKIENGVKGQKGCEFGIMLLVGAVNLFTANNTVAIVVAGPIAKELSRKYNCDPRRIASILDASSCVVQGLIPYGAQILIAVGLAQNANLQISSLGLIGALYYPMLLALALLASIFFRKQK
jgi:Na+/H+ antiporter NhaC